MKIQHRTPEEREEQINILLEELQHNMDELMALAQEAADIRRDGLQPRKARAGKKR